jgi:hypothetical protein
MIFTQINVNNVLNKNFQASITNFVTAVSKREDGQLTETCKGNKYL